MAKITGEKQVFEKVWERQNGICFITDQYIPLEQLRPWNFPHILPKGQNKYPDFKLLETNVIMTVKRFHDLYDQGTHEQLYDEFRADKLKKFFQLKECLLLQHEILYKNSKSLFKQLSYE